MRTLESVNSADGVLAASDLPGRCSILLLSRHFWHLMGAALRNLVGTWAAILVMTCVVGVQALIFQDGGYWLLGANIFNMGIVGVAVSYTTYQIIRLYG